LLAGLDYDTLLRVIQQIDSVDYNVILQMLADQKTILDREGVEWEGYERDLLLEQLNDYWIMQQLMPIISDERFSLYNWRDLNVEDRKDLLQEFMDEIVDIFGIEVNPEIQFFDRPSTPEGIRLGTYLHRRGIWPLERTVREVSINEWVIENEDELFSHELLFRTVIHELRHGYQESAVDNPDDFILSAPTIHAWEMNSNNYILPEVNRTAYETQIIEVDARGLEQAWCEVRVCLW